MPFVAVVGLAKSSGLRSALEAPGHAGTWLGKSAEGPPPSAEVHRLRHSWATLALKAGVHPKVVQERLRHSTIGITLDLYSHVLPAMETDAADRIAALTLGVQPGA